MRALLSTFDKSGLIPLARFLHDAGCELVATGGTAALLTREGLPVTAVEGVTGFPEGLGGRVKTLHPALHAGLLARPTEDDAAELRRLGLTPVDVLVVNLYPFRARRQEGLAPDALVEEVDIGGVALLRAAAKNHARVLVLADPSRYEEAMRRGPAGWDAAYRLQEAAYAFRMVAAYDADIAETFSAWSGDRFPERWTVTGDRLGALRYGENPHQAAALYGVSGTRGVTAAQVLQGKALSYNNWADADAAWRAVWDLPGAGAVGLKHQMPCAAALAPGAAAAFRRVREGDPVSIFGGIVAFNQPVDGEAAQGLTDLFLEVVVAPAVTPEARTVLARKPNLRVLEAPPPEPGHYTLTSLGDGFLVQERDASSSDPEAWVRRAGTDDALAARVADARLAWVVVRHARSNAVVLARDGMTVGIGQGQTNRIDAVRHALAMAGERARGAVLASDAFFFPDTVEALAAAGVAVAVSPGGSLRDGEVVEAAERRGLSLWFTGDRHFRH
jgi:phosphoribosylaminoimidazolecarboxamide formyltransferase/IMP cyclohydrolase